MKALIVVAVLGLFAAPAFADSLVENFNNVAALSGAGWVLTNNSSPGGTTGWFQGNPAVFPALQGPANSYIGANFQNAAPGGNISNWLLTPAMTLNNGDTISFYTRGAGIFADRLELRFSTSGASTDVGATDTSVGVFPNLLLTVNPTLNPNGYPTAWTQFSLTISGLGGPTTGRYAFRYFVPNTNTNANYIGIDTLQVTSVPEPAMLPILSLSLAALVCFRRARARL